MSLFFVFMLGIFAIIRLSLSLSLSLSLALGPLFFAHIHSFAFALSLSHSSHIIMQSTDWLEYSRCTIQRVAWWCLCCALGWIKVNIGLYSIFRIDPFSPSFPLSFPSSSFPASDSTGIWREGKRRDTLPIDCLPCVSVCVCVCGDCKLLEEKIAHKTTPQSRWDLTMAKTCFLGRLWASFCAFFAFTLFRLKGWEDEDNCLCHRAKDIRWVRNLFHDRSPNALSLVSSRRGLLFGGDFFSGKNFPSPAYFCEPVLLFFIREATFHLQFLIRWVLECSLEHLIVTPAWSGAGLT